jgi:uncharacterized ferritin-like protein (DUF455 family)
MEIREFAEHILFATSLEEKLRPPGPLTDAQPGPALATPAMPGRPAQLVFKPHAVGKSEFPGLHRLDELSERGKLLHFFGNHELLATELMALVLLKFPDAPAAFRRGVLQTLQDEQQHTQLYLERMQACGLTLGDLPVSGYFWRCIAPMEHPIDYVAGLCLTFEQANLDFAGHYGRCFATVGDAGSARLLEKIYRDEIGHVAYGLKWFRRWKNPNESDWDAFCRTLKFPLSPQRAKGFALNVAGRRAAGLDPEFIAQLNVYSQSKGRTPSVFVFNPFTEGRLAEGKKFNPTKPQAELAADLQNLPQFLCRQDDLVLTGHKPSVAFLSRIKQAGFPLPEFLECVGSPPRECAALHSRKLGSLRPWAWGPDSLELLQPLFPSVTGEQRSDAQRFNEGLAQLYSKAWSANFLRQFLAANPAADWLCTGQEVGEPVHSSAEARAALARIRARGHHPVVVKRAFGVAGSNALRLLEPAPTAAQWRWMENAFAHHQELIVEPWLDRVQDFSVQLEMTGGRLKVAGYTGLVNDARGQFMANVAEAHHQKRLPSRVVAAFPGAGDISGRLLALYADLLARLESELRAREFAGPLGVDAFVYRDAVGGVRLKPVVEINPRFTMGRVLVELMRQTCQNSLGQFRLIGAAQLRAEGFADFSACAHALETRYPLQLAGEPSARIREGVLCLNEPAAAQTCLAVFRVVRTLEALATSSG